MSVATRVEGVRGCGFRKPGGLYLVSGNLSEPCSRLPIELDVCPTCGHGIKPARGWTWVNGHELIPPLAHGTAQHSAICPFGVPLTSSPQPPRLGERCGLIWIGESFYPTPGHFMYEASRMGVSRRISAVPRGFVVGETWVLLGHRKGVMKGYEVNGEAVDLNHWTAGEAAVREHWAPAIFTAFRPTAVEYVVTGEETEEEIEALEARGITPVKVVREGELLPA